ncbi:MAG: hypothetical protein NWE92_09220 [Candidatus Bathyarchaeota archaeon]|nr:hypothetical protein [Candidatus Bathyarchaeota archaeon]
MNTSEYPKTDSLLLVGDNAFQGVNHLSQDRARVRVNDITSPDYCAELVLTAIGNGADGFMFSVNDRMLSILGALKNKNPSVTLNLHAIVPSAVDYVRVSGQKGMEGMVKDFTHQMITSHDAGAALACFQGVVKRDVKCLLAGLLSLEIDQIKSASGKKGELNSVLLHELLTDMALALDLKWFFESFIAEVQSHNVVAGFETRNFALLLKKIRQWRLSLDDVVLVAPFNSVGFQMNPSREECEAALNTLSEANVLAMNVLASGYLSVPEAVDYLKGLPNLRGVAVGVSKQAHAIETFQFLKQNLTPKQRICP